MYRAIGLLLIACLFSSGRTQAAPTCAAGGCTYLPLVSSSGPLAVAVGQPFSYTDSISYLHIIGEVRNTIGGSIELVRIAANIFDSHGKLVATDHSYAYLDPLPNNTSTCFDVLLKAPADIGSIQFERPTYYPSSTLPALLSITNDSGAYDPNLHSYKIIGQVTNNDLAQVKFVRVTATLYNASGQAIGCNFTYVSSTDLDPGQTSSFSLSTYGRDYNDVASYKLQVQGDK
jgi:hypothetical protein